MSDGGAGGRILVIDDEAQITRVLRAALTAQGYQVRTANDPEEGLVIYREWMPDLVITDLMMPTMTGVDVCRAIRLIAATPVLVLSVRDHERSKVEALDAGADDYVTKPFQIQELLARVHAVLRRAAPEEARDGILRVADLELDENSHEVTRGGDEIHLTATEFELLRYLMRNERVVLSKAQILDRVWKYDFQDQSNIVELYVGYLRKKVDAVEPKLIHTVRGAGYVIKAPRV